MQNSATSAVIGGQENLLELPSSSTDLFGNSSIPKFKDQHPQGFAKTATVRVPIQNRLAETKFANTNEWKALLPSNSGIIYQDAELEVQANISTHMYMLRVELTFKKKMGGQWNEIKA